MPSAPVQSAFTLHATQTWFVVSQTGKPAGQSVTFVALHCTHEPATHAGASADVHAALAPAFPKSPLHATQVPLATLQIGFEPEHVELLTHSTHFSVVGLHTSFVPVQRMVSPGVHSTQAPVPRSHAGAVVVGHARVALVLLSPLHPAQEPAALQTGVLPPQLAEVLHWTQTCEAPQNGVLPPQSASVPHATQTPATQCAVGALHCASAAQVLVHVPLATSQKGVAPTHAVELAAVHWTHLCWAVSHTEVAPVHAVESVPLQFRQLPLTHAGLVAVGHSEVAPERWLPLQAVQTFPVQTGKG